MKTTPKVAAIALAAACALSACSFNRPSADDVAKALTSDNAVIPIPAGQANCVAKVLVDSDLSDETLQAIVKADTKYKGSDAEQSKLVTTLSTAQKTCNK